jgi:hypothetical protein
MRVSGVPMLYRTISAVTTISLLLGAVIVMNFETSANLNLDVSEKALKETMATTVVQRKQWMKDIFRYHDYSAVCHVFFPFLVAAGTNSVAWGLLVSYLYESVYFVLDLYVVDSEYYVRMPDSLIQDPVQALIGSLAALAMWGGTAEIDKVSTVVKQHKLMVVLATVGTTLGDIGGINNVVGSFTSLARFGASLLILAVLVQLGILKQGAGDMGTLRSMAIMILTALVPCVAAQFASYAGLYYKAPDPFQSSMWWMALMLSLMALALEALGVMNTYITSYLQMV